MLFDKENSTVFLHRCLAGNNNNNCVDDELLLKGAEYTHWNKNEKKLLY